MENLILHLGSNLGDRRAFLDRAILEISKRIGTIDKQSSFYETGAWGITDIPNFINVALWVKTSLSAHDSLKEALAIEKEIGRTPAQKWSSRVIDIDLLFYNEEIIASENLDIPHIHIQARNFVLTPVCEIASTYVHPVLKLTIQELKDTCKDHCFVNMLEE